MTDAAADTNTTDGGTADQGAAGTADGASQQ